MTAVDGLTPALLVEIEQQATAWAGECGRLAEEQLRRGLVVEYKGAGRRDPVTETDRQVEDFLRDNVLRRFPEHRVLGEERPDLGPPEADFVWVIDPIDGTANFASGIPLFAVSIGVLHQGVPVVAALYVTQSVLLKAGVLHARRGGGCFIGEQALRAFEEPALHPSYPAALPAAFWRRFHLGRALRANPVEVRTTGSIAFELGLIAGGGLQFGAYRAPRIWDVAAGVLLIEEAGGLVMTWDKRRSAWVALSRFVAPPANNGREPGPLRNWARPVLAGGRHVTAFVAQQLRPRGGLSAQLAQMLWRIIGS
jgi:myo-inositol-1(or 4)-monophosphatase